jgi:enoyl-CoA hydratase
MNERSFVEVERQTAKGGAQPIAVAIEGAIAIATLCRPPVNAIDDDWLARLDEILDEVERAGGVNVLWIRSSQRVFCAGADLEYMRARFATDDGRKQLIAFTRRMQAVYARLEAMGVVSIAEIGGAALGGGFELALACDLRVVAESAKVGLPEVRLGLLPAAGGTQRLTRIGGDAIARRLILGAEVVDGTEAVALGLAHWVVPTTGLEAVVRSVAQRIADLPGAALAVGKRCIAAALDEGQNGFETELTGSGMLLALPETQQRVRRFLEEKI